MPEISIFSRMRIFWIHLAFWTFYLSVKFLDFFQHFQISLASYYVAIPSVFNITASYINLFLFLPLLLKGKRIPFIILSVSTVLMVVLIRLEVEHIILFGMFERDYYAEFSMVRFLYAFWETTLFMTFVSMINLAVERFDLKKEQVLIQKEKLNTELKLLKSQLNPHFIFNTLQNLNYLTYTKSDESSAVIMKLSNIMRFMFYEVNKSAIPLKSELGLILDYVDLQKIRLGNRIKTILELEPGPSNVFISPLIMMTLVENAFKFGVPEDNSSTGEINIKLNMMNNVLFFQIKNKIFRENLTSSGFGLKGLKKILSANYNDKAELIIKEESNIYNATLKIDTQ